MLAIGLHQLRDHLMSARFQLSLLVLLAFFGVNGLVYTWKLDKLQREIAMIDRADAAAYAGVASVQQGVSQWFRNQGNHPRGTEFIVDGGVDLLATTLVVPTATGTLPYAWQAITWNRIIDNFQVVDWALIVRFAISFLCIVLAYDTVSRELESGTLRLVLATPTSRARFLAGRYLAHLATVMLAVAVGILVSLVIISLGGHLTLSGAVAGAAALFLAGVVAYATLFLSLAMAVSALARSSAASSVLLVMVWAVLVVVVPQSSALIGVQAADVPYEWWSEGYELYGTAQQELADQGLTLRGRQVGAADGYLQERRVIGRLRGAETDQERLYVELQHRLARQSEVARAVNLLSPGYAFQYGVEALLGTGVVYRDALEGQMWEYRRTLREFFRQADAADPESPGLWFFPDYMSTAPLDPARIPRFVERRMTLADGVIAGAAPLSILLLETLAAILLALWAINRADITRE